MLMNKFKTKKQKQPKAYSRNEEKGRGVLCGGGRGRVYIPIATLSPPE